MLEASVPAPAHRTPEVRITDGGTRQLILVTVPVLVDPGAYEENYGEGADMVTYTDEVIKNAASEQMARLGWGRVPEPGENY
jgi:hypothetical protein